jgi:hypothetical protein
MICADGRAIQATRENSLDNCGGVVVNCHPRYCRASMCDPIQPRKAALFGDCECHTLFDRGRVPQI